MKCERVRELMSAYIDNEINEVDKVKFEKHIAQCSQCKEEYELLMDIVNECSNIDEEELPEGFREELHNKLMQAKDSKSHKLSGYIRKNRWKVYAGTTVAAAVLIFALSVGGFNLPKVSEQSAEDISREDRGTDTRYSMTMDNEIAPAPASEPTVGAPEIQSIDKNKVMVQFGEDMSGNNAGIQSMTTAAPDTKEANKIIKNGNISLKVAELQNAINQVAAMTEQMGGYIESSYVSDIENPIVIENAAVKEKTTKVGNITIKIPAKQFESTFQSILAIGTVVNQSTNTNDITKTYMDMESRLNNLKLQEKSYQDLLSKAQNVDEMLKVENELNRIRTEIDIMQGDLKRWDDQVEYSTIYINLTEVKEAELEKVDTLGVWQRARQGLINTLNNIKNGIAWLFVFIISAMPYIGILGAGTLLAVLWIKRRKKE